MGWSRGSWGSYPTGAELGRCGVQMATLPLAMTGLLSKHQGRTNMAGGGGVQAPLGRPLPPRLSAMMPGKGVKSSSDRGLGAPCCPFHLARRVPTPSAASALRPRSPKALPHVQNALGVTDDFVKLRPPPGRSVDKFSISQAPL